MLEVLISNCDEIMNYHQTKMIKHTNKHSTKIYILTKNQSHHYFDNLCFKIKWLPIYNFFSILLHLFQWDPYAQSHSCENEKHYSIASKKGSKWHNCQGESDVTLNITNTFMGSKQLSCVICLLQKKQFQIKLIKHWSKN